MSCDRKQVFVVICIFVICTVVPVVLWKVGAGTNSDPVLAVHFVILSLSIFCYLYPDLPETQFFEKRFAMAFGGKYEDMEGQQQQVDKGDHRDKFLYIFDILMLWLIYTEIIAFVFVESGAMFPTTHKDQNMILGSSSGVAIVCVVLFMCLRKMIKLAWMIASTVFVIISISAAINLVWWAIVLIAIGVAAVQAGLVWLYMKQKQKWNVEFYVYSFIVSLTLVMTSFTLFKGWPELLAGRYDYVILFGVAFGVGLSRVLVSHWVTPYFWKEQVAYRPVPTNSPQTTL